MVGWTLVLNNAAGGFDETNILSRFPTQPSLTADYSIYGLADDILTLGRAWSYMIEVDVVGSDDSTSTVGGIYTVPGGVTICQHTLSTRRLVELTEQIGDWEASALGLQHLLPELVLEPSLDLGMTSLISTAMRPKANMWGAPPMLARLWAAVRRLPLAR